VSGKAGFHALFLTGTPKSTRAKFHIVTNIPYFLLQTNIFMKVTPKIFRTIFGVLVEYRTKMVLSATLSCPKIKPLVRFTHTRGGFSK
jgi:hypothetical protein